MLTEEYLDQHFYYRFGELKEEVILQLDEEIFNDSLINVVTGLQSHCFGLGMFKKDGTDFQLFFITNAGPKLEGALLNLQLLEQERTKLVMVFAKYVAHNYNLDILDVFNTYQDKIRTMCEKLGYFTITSREMNKLRGKDPMFFAPNKKGVIVINFYEHHAIYRELFGKVDSYYEKTGESYVYLMFNHKNKYIKIGKSIDPRHREKTLQAEEPEITMIAVWKASERLEKILHQQYAAKRQRGEWFNLSFQDLKAIKIFVDQFIAN